MKGRSCACVNSKAVIIERALLFSRHSPTSCLTHVMLQSSKACTLLRHFNIAESIGLLQRTHNCCACIVIRSNPQRSSLSTVLSPIHGRGCWECGAGWLYIRKLPSMAIVVSSPATSTPTQPIARLSSFLVPAHILSKGLVMNKISFKNMNVRTDHKRDSGTSQHPCTQERPSTTVTGSHTRPSRSFRPAMCTVCCIVVSPALTMSVSRLQKLLLRRL